MTADERRAAAVEAQRAATVEAARAELRKRAARSVGCWRIVTPTSTARPTSTSGEGDAP